MSTEDVSVGKNNRARRAAKAKARAKRPGGREDSRQNGPHGGRPGDNPRESSSFGSPFPGPPPPSGPEAEWALLEQAAHANAPDLPNLAHRVVRDHPVRGDRAAERILLAYVDGLWRAGWQPRELVRQARRKATVASAQVVELAIIVDHEGRPGQALDPRWVAQLDELASRGISTRGGWLRNWRGAHGHDEVWATIQVAKAMAAIGYLPTMDVLIPPPGASAKDVTHGIAVEAAADDPVLRRIRKLLSKAESTQFDDEADALTAKAHELMTKHAIDHALLHQHESTDVPRTMRVPIDAPYADAKSFLLQVVSTSQRCRSIFHDGLDLSSVIGHTGDLQAVELLFTSLLVQAQHELKAAASGAGARARGQSYRSAFYLAYAQRISERLRAVTEEVLAETHDRTALPVLVAREDATAAAFDERFAGSLVKSQVRGGWDPLGSAHGRSAADAARLDSGAITGP